VYVDCGEVPLLPGLGGAGAEEYLMQFEGSGYAPVGWVESKCDGFRVLVCHVECVAQVHEEGVAVPPKAVLDV
jgi:hypothetical protein